MLTVFSVRPFVLRSALTALLYTAQVMGSMLDDVINKRTEYQENCTRSLKATFPTGTDATRNVYKECTVNGTWKTEENSSSVWRNHSECEDHNFFKPQVIFYIFLKIIRLLLSKLKADQVKFTDYRYSLARATLVLIPLLGIHEIVFTIIINESIEDSKRYARDFVHLTLSSFQGLLVAVLYCFANGEVQAELKKRWQLFVSSNHFEVHNCFTDIHPKHLWKCSKKSPGQNTEQSESNEDRGHAPTQAHQLQVAVQSAEDVGCGRSSGLEFYMRKSLSSSDGEITSGETMEEIIEESEF
ncbi:Glucagon-like peptide 2 receptor [Anabarilius grahami]|uniref:Glucagon-like peptide 2 receptor n=1 Tax=Anabarilius grahami TaxID=495550 RepID=A0A3N0XTW5_ANAGA|nr:Glucagon-like peptide 2 receptor [Anabarilius grahami]